LRGRREKNHPRGKQTNERTNKQTNKQTNRWSFDDLGGERNRKHRTSSGEAEPSTQSNELLCLIIPNSFETVLFELVSSVQHREEVAGGGEEEKLSLVATPEDEGGSNYLIRWNEIGCVGSKGGRVVPGEGEN